MVVFRFSQDMMQFHLLLTTIVVVIQDFHPEFIKYFFRDAKNTSKI